MQTGLLYRMGKYLFGYDAVESKNRRQAPTGRLRSEDKELLAHQRRKLTSAARDIHRNFTIAAWAIRKHLDYVSTFSFQSRTGSADLDGRNRGKWLDLYAEDDIDKAELTKRSRADAAAVERLDGELDTLRRRLDAATGDDAATAKTRKILATWERGMTDAADDLRRQLDGLPWNARRTLLTRLLGLDPITLGWRPYASIRAIQKRRGQNPDAFMERWCVQPPKPGETGGLFIVDVTLPVNPAAILDALAAVGVRPVFASKKPALASRCG